MNICQNCFADTELKAVVASSKTLGVCDICGKKTFVYDTTNSDRIVDIIDDFMNMYIKADSAIPKNFRLNLENELINKWKIFSHDCVYKVKNIIKEIYSFSRETKERFDLSLFDDDVYIPQALDEGYLIDHAILKNNQWNDFIKSIKYENRYHSNMLNKVSLDTFIEPLLVEYPKNACFYRARISSKKGFSPKELGMPPAENARAGRIGAEGIPCFYLAKDRDTAIKEVRAGAFDYVTIAKFKLKESIKVIDLRLLGAISPFSISDPVTLAINRDTLAKIKEEVEKPVRITENHIEYVPIQYICDYIRSKGYKGIIYNSTMSSQGYNVAAFSDCDFKYAGREVYYIKDLSVDFNKV